MNKRRFRPKFSIILSLAILSLILLVGCASRAPTSEAMPAQVVVEEMVEVPVEMGAPAMEAPAADMVYGDESAAANLGSMAERMIIRSADLAIVVEDTETAMVQLRDVARGVNGYIANTNIWRAGDQLRGNVTIRVPSESFDAAMDQIKDLAVQVDRENISGTDVTEEYTDLSSRLRNLEATETELLALLTEVREKTRRAEDVLAIHRELTNIRGQIEQVKGRKQFLERMTALATINVELIPEVAAPTVESGWKPVRTLREALQSLISAGQFLVDAGIWLVVFVLPVILILLAPLVLLVYGVRRWRRRRKAKAKEVATPNEGTE